MDLLIGAVTSECSLVLITTPSSASECTLIGTLISSLIVTLASRSKFYSADRYSGVWIWMYSDR